MGSNTEPFVSEVLGEAGDELRRRGGDKGEFGATTGRPRRVGWFDTVATKYGCMVQGATQVALTCLDVLGYLDEIPVCVAYDIDGEITTDFPTTARLEKAKPVIEKLPGWKESALLVRKIAENYKLPYYTISPTYSICRITAISTGSSTPARIAAERQRSTAGSPDITVLYRTGTTGRFRSLRIGKSTTLNIP